MNEWRYVVVSVTEPRTRSVSVRTTWVTDESMLLTVNPWGEPGFPPGCNSHTFWGWFHSSHILLLDLMSLFGPITIMVLFICSKHRFSLPQTPWANKGSEEFFYYGPPFTEGMHLCILDIYRFACNDNQILDFESSVDIDQPLYITWSKRYVGYIGEYGEFDNNVKEFNKHKCVLS